MTDALTADTAPAMLDGSASLAETRSRGKPAELPWAPGWFCPGYDMFNSNGYVQRKADKSTIRQPQKRARGVGPDYTGLTGWKVGVPYYVRKDKRAGINGGYTRIEYYPLEARTIGEAIREVDRRWPVGAKKRRWPPEEEGT